MGDQDRSFGHKDTGQKVGACATFRGGKLGYHLTSHCSVDAFGKVRGKNIVALFPDTVYIQS